VLHTILVPLDRSPLAAQALPLALELAWRAGAILDLVAVHGLYALEDPGAARLPYSALEDAEFRRHEQDYLDATAERLAKTHCVPIRTAVVNGLVVDGLLEWQRDHPADLMVMTTHGRGPVSRAFLGSVADELLRRTPVPLLLVRPHTLAPSAPAAPVVTHMLIPLDGSPLAEQVLPPALELARLLEARCTLLRVIESDDAPTVHTSCRPCAPPEADAMAYLESVARTARAQGLRVDTRVATARHAAACIVEQSQKSFGYIIALATHGRGGLRRMLLGSVADKVIRGSTLPVLVFRPHAP
jgi:nucleotide-binding universal stress UspA family protein